MISSTQREKQEAYGAQEQGVVDLKKNEHVGWLVEGIRFSFYYSRSIRSRG